MKFDFSQLKTTPQLRRSLDLTSSIDLDFSQVREHFAEIQEEQATVSATLRAEYARRRRCTATKPDGQPCKGWAVWHASEQKCLGHLSPEARAAHEVANQTAPRKTPRPTCDCEAYPFPHRPGNMLCIAPQSPLMVHPLAAGQRAAGKKRRRDEKRLQQRLKAKYGF